MPSTLLVIDFQEEWRDKNSNYYLGQFKSQLRNASKLVKHFHEKQWPVIFTRHVDVGSISAFADGTKSTEVLPELNVAVSDRVLTKNRISPFYKTDLENILMEQKPDELVVAGIMTNLCVRIAVSDAYDRDYHIKLVTDACVSDSAEVDRFTFKDLKKTRPEIDFVKTRDVISKK